MAILTFRPLPPVPIELDFGFVIIENLFIPDFFITPYSNMNNCITSTTRMNAVSVVKIFNIVICFLIKFPYSLICVFGCVGASPKVSYSVILSSK